MGETTGVDWARSTFNPWRGCKKVSRACRFCYAERVSARSGVLWGAHTKRIIAAESTWKLPERWNRKAAATGEDWPVFCASLADVCEDNPQVVEARKRLVDLIERTGHLTWMLLTKRPEHADLLGWGTSWPAHVWFGATAESQDEAGKRLPALVASGARTKFVSVEPMQGHVDLSRWLPAPPQGIACGPRQPASEDMRIVRQFGQYLARARGPRPYLDWVICGGESGARDEVQPLDPTWVSPLRDQCAAAGVPFFFKQWGEFAPVVVRDEPQMMGGRGFAHPRGGVNAAVIRERKAGRIGSMRPLRPGDVTRGGVVMYDLNTVGVAVGTKTAGYQLDGREWRDRPERLEISR